MSDDETSPMRLQTLRMYLTLHGWRRQPSEHTAFDLYSLGTSRNPIEILLPIAGSSKNPARWVNAALRTLSQLDDVEEANVSASVRSVAFDAVRSKVPDNRVADDTISFEVAADMISELRSLFEAAATTELNPRPYFPRVLKAAKSYLREVRFGHTYKGSFGFLIESPIQEAPGPAPLGLDPIPPFERRVVERVARGIALVPHARGSNSKNVVLENFGAGLSANMCDALVGIIRTTGGVEFSFELSPLIEAGPKIGKEPVFLGQEDADFLVEVAISMREKREVQATRLVGQVVELRTRGIPGDLTDLASTRQIAITGDVAGRGDLEVRVNLSPADYLTALGAHAEGRALSLEGNLEQIGRNWFLLEPKLQLEMQFEYATATRTVAATQLPRLPKPRS